MKNLDERTKEELENFISEKMPCVAIFDENIEELRAIVENYLEKGEEND